MEKIIYYDDLCNWNINKKVTIYCDGNQFDSLVEFLKINPHRSEGKRTNTKHAHCLGGLFYE